MAKFLDKIMNAMKLNDTMEDEMDMDITEKEEEVSTAQNIRPARRESKVETERYERPERPVRTSEKSSMASYSTKPQLHNVHSVN